MNIANINPKKLKFSGKDPTREPKRKTRPEMADGRRRFQPSVTNDIEYISRPIALEFRNLIYDRKISQLKAAEMVGAPVKTLQRWISPSRQGDCPNYLLQKLKEALKIDC